MAPPGVPPSNAKVEQFAALLATCQRKVFLYVMGLLHNPTDAEEVLQETNLVLWRKFDQYEQGTDFVHWACRVAYYEVLKFREKMARQERPLSSEFIEVLAAESRGALDQADPRREALARCLQKLTERDRRLLLDRYQPAATTRSLAEALGRSVQGTRKSLHRIRMTLLECIQRTLAVAAREP